MANNSQNIPDWSARQVIQATLVVISVGLGFYMFYHDHLVVLVLFAAIILGTAICPIVDWFVRKGLSRGYSLALTFLFFLAGCAVVIILTVPMLLQQMLQLSVSLPQTYLVLRTALLNTSSLLLQNIGQNLPSNLPLVLKAFPLQSEPLDAVNSFIGMIGTLFKGLMITMAIFLLTSFWIMEKERTLRSLWFVVPSRYRQQAREIFELIESRVGAFVLGQLTLCLIIGLLALIAFLILGLPNALALALIAGLFEAIPVFGPALGAIPAVLVAFSIEPMLAVWVIIAMGFIQGLENYLLVPRVMGVAVGVNPMITLLSLAAFTSLLGLPGGLISIPLAAVIQVLWNRFVISKDQLNSSMPVGRDLNSVLRYEVQDLIGDVRKLLRKKGVRSDEAADQVEDAIEALASDLDLYLDQNS